MLTWGVIQDARSKRTLRYDRKAQVVKWTISTRPRSYPFIPWTRELCGDPKSSLDVVILLLSRTVPQLPRFNRSRPLNLEDTGYGAARPVRRAVGFPSRLEVGHCFKSTVITQYTQNVLQLYANLIFIQYHVKQISAPLHPSLDKTTICGSMI
jgi:hypothetical protein